MLALSKVPYIIHLNSFLENHLFPTRRSPVDIHIDNLCRRITEIRDEANAVAHSLAISHPDASSVPEHNSGADSNNNNHGSGLDVDDVDSS